MEADHDMKHDMIPAFGGKIGIGNSYTTEFRGNDPRLGRWWSCDPLEAKYPSISTYSYAINNPIMFIDPDGKDIFFYMDPKYKKIFESVFNVARSMDVINDLIKDYDLKGFYADKYDLYIGVQDYYTPRERHPTFWNGLSDGDDDDWGAITNRDANKWNFIDNNAGVINIAGEINKYFETGEGIEGIKNMDYMDGMSVCTSLLQNKTVILMNFNDNTIWDRMTFSDFLYDIATTWHEIYCHMYLPINQGVINTVRQHKLSGDPESPSDLDEHINGKLNYDNTTPYGKLVDYFRNHLDELKEQYKEIEKLHKSENPKMYEVK
jgi:RHS repeat-associated protein